MVVILGVAVGLLLAGLLICFLSGSAGRIATVVWWVGIILAVIGIILLITPVLVWVSTQLKMMLGV